MVYFGLALMFYFDFWTFLSNAKRVCMVCPCKPIAFIKIGKRKAMIWLFFTMQSFSLDLGQMIVLPCLSHSQSAPFIEIWLIWLSPIRAIICKREFAEFNIVLFIKQHTKVEITRGRFLASLACGLGTSTRNQQACQLGLTSAHCSAVELFTANMTTFLSSLTTA